MSCWKVLFNFLILMYKISTREMPGGSWNHCLWTVLSNSLKPIWNSKAVFSSAVLLHTRWIKFLSLKYLQDPIETLIPQVISLLLTLFPSVWCMLKTDAIQPFLLSSNLFSSPSQVFLNCFSGLYTTSFIPLRFFLMNCSTLWTLVWCWCECSVCLSVICMSSSVYK